MHEQPEDIRAKFERIVGLIKDKGLENVGMPYVRPLAGKLLEIRMRGRDGIARAIFVTQKGKRIVVVRVFQKKTQKTPRREIKLAQERAKEL